MLRQTLCAVVVGHPPLWASVAACFLLCKLLLMLHMLAAMAILTYEAHNTTYAT